MTLLGVMIFVAGFLVGWVVRNLVEANTSGASWICSRCLFEQTNTRMVCERCGNKQRIT